MSLSKNKIKYIRSFDSKKVRKEEKAFLAEGPKVTGDLLPVFHCHFLAATAQWLEGHPGIEAEEIVEVGQEELTRASLLKTPQQVLAIFEQPQYEMNYDVVNSSLSLALDDIQDPGNLGTIVRLADWFGIEHIVCSPNTADVFSPKAIQATMGAIARVKVHYGPLHEFISHSGKIPVYGTFLDGENIYRKALSHNGIIIMGNEGNGISADVERLVTDKLYIPSFPPERETSESLNVAIATAIVCAEFRRTQQAASSRSRMGK